MGRIEFASPLTGCIPVDFGTPVTYWVVAPGRRVPVTNLFDVDGMEITDPQKACGCVALMPNGKYMAMGCEPKDLILNGGH